MCRAAQKRGFARAKVHKFLLAQKFREGLRRGFHERSRPPTICLAQTTSRKGAANWGAQRKSVVLLAQKFREGERRTSVQQRSAL